MGDRRCKKRKKNSLKYTKIIRRNSKHNAKSKNSYSKRNRKKKRKCSMLRNNIKISKKKC